MAGDKGEQRKQLFAGQFDVSMDNQKIPNVVRVSPIRVTIPKAECTTGLDEIKRYQPGQPKFEDVTIEFEAHDDSLKPILSWWETWHEKRDEGKRANWTINVREQQKDSPARSITLEETFPLELTEPVISAHSGGHAVCSLRLHVGRVEIS